jgi:uncharacterized protein (UPF0210 family)
MRIRTVTYFLNPGWPVNMEAVQNAGQFLQTAKESLTRAGYEVQSVRLATSPFLDLLRGNHLDDALELATSLEQAAQQHGIQYLSLGPVFPHQFEGYAMIPSLLEATNRVFFSASLGTLEGEVSIPAVHACAEVITRASRISADGFANLRFAALANVPAGAPFFPAAYHSDGPPAFAIGTESADLAVDAFSGVKCLADGRERLVRSFEKHGQTLSSLAGELARQSDVAFNGIDFTMAPYPEESRSIGTAFERLGVPQVGMSGSLAAAAILADTLDLADFPRAGFNGLFLPVLEDSVLARRAAEGILSLTDLLLYSCMCGTGLDTLPLPGDASPDQISAVLLDLTALAYRLDKSLTARLMPIPGKSAGDPVQFDFPYFASSRVMELKAARLTGLLANRAAFGLRPKRRVHQ